MPKRVALALVLVAAVACGDDPGPGGRAVVTRADDPILAGVHFYTGAGTVESGLLGLADSPAERARGLMGVEHLDSDGGMVFVFDEPASGAFWMKDTSIPLSLAVWDDEGRIIDILDMQPCRADPCHRYRPAGPFLGAIEMRQGFFEENGVEVGDRIEVELITE